MKSPLSGSESFPLCLVFRAFLNHELILTCVTLFFCICWHCFSHYFANSLYTFKYYILFIKNKIVVAWVLQAMDNRKRLNREYICWGNWLQNEQRRVRWAGSLDTPETSTKGESRGEEPQTSVQHSNILTCPVGRFVLVVCQKTLRPAPPSVSS